MTKKTSMEKIIDPIAIADEIVQLFDKYGSADYIGEVVSQIQHMTQCARLAQQAGQDEDIILAALLHDIGHLCEYMMPTRRMNEFGVVDHEELGHEYLFERGFSKKICKIVSSHVKAKRYLTFKYPHYFDLLSTASKETLQLQGGVMSAEEAYYFEKDPLFQYYIMLRKWDDQSKNPNLRPMPIQQFRSMIIRHLEIEMQKKSALN